MVIAGETYYICKPEESSKCINWALEYTGEVLVNPINSMALYQGLLRSNVEFDFGILMKTKPVILHMDGLWIHGSQNGDGLELVETEFSEPSNISAPDDIRIYQIWVETHLSEANSVKVGIIAVDEEFVVSEINSLFALSLAGWPPFLSMNIPGGGGGYPDPALGMRLKSAIDQNNIVLFGVFEGDASQHRRSHGLDIDIVAAEGVFVISEIQHIMFSQKNPSIWNGTYKIGGWFHTGKFPRYQLTNEETYIELNGSMYAVMQHKLFSEEDMQQGLYGSFRIAPFISSDRNVVDFYCDAALVYKGLVPAREQDELGIVFCYTETSSKYRSYMSSVLFEGPTSYEKVIELTYRFVFNNYLHVQPLIQYIINSQTQDKWILGLRLIAKY